MRFSVSGKFRRFISCDGQGAGHLAPFFRVDYNQICISLYIFDVYTNASH